jgi:hypothetical protein
MESPVTLEIVATLKGSFDLLKAIKDALSTKKKYDLADEICRALRTIYFTPDGVLSLLKEMERRGHVSPARIQEGLAYFNDGECTVQAALVSLEFNKLVEQLELTITTLKMLEDVRWGKISLRAEIRRQINYYDQSGRKPNRKRLKDIIGGIEQLNNEIEKIEKLVNLRAQDR